MRREHGGIMSFWPFCLAFVAGIAVPLQTAINTRLRLSLDDSTTAASLISFATGTVVLLLITVLQPGAPRLALGAFQQPAWKLFGGPIGVAFVFGLTFLAPKIGLASLLSLVIAGQVLSSIGFDYFGLFGLAQHKLNWQRVLGAGLIIAGVMLVNWSSFNRSS